MKLSTITSAQSKNIRIYCRKFHSKSMDSSTNAKNNKIHENLLDKKFLRRFIFQHLATHKQFQIIRKKKKLIIKQEWEMNFFFHSDYHALNPFHIYTFMHSRSQSFPWICWLSRKGQKVWTPNNCGWPTSILKKREKSSTSQEYS